MNIAIITACPSGVASSILAAGLLEQAAEKLGYSAKIECQSRFVDSQLLMPTWSLSLRTLKYP